MANKTEMGDFQTAQTLETFGFLPRFSQDEVYDQKDAEGFIKISALRLRLAQSQK